MGNDAGTSANAGVQQAISQLMNMNEASQAAAATGPLPAQEVPTVFDLLGLNALAVAGFSISDVGIALSAQIIWTLAREDIKGPYVIHADGAALDDRFAAGWNTSDVAATDPGVDQGAA
ncbi:hypothetical protein H7J72_00005, partial [Mycobacterium shimoidei]|nr:hypothetical protein [Mycobacterium shimoidei]